MHGGFINRTVTQKKFPNEASSPALNLPGLFNACDSKLVF